MPIVPPLLDDRTWKDLRDEALARVPVYTSEWTDVRPGDPGVTIVELFAYLTEALIYRLNRVPDNSYIAFLNLLGQPPLPAEPAGGIVEFAVKGITSTTLSKSTTVSAGKIKFASQDSLSVLPVELAGYLKCRVQTPAPKSDARAYADSAFNAFTRAQKDKTQGFTKLHYATKAYPPTDGSVMPLSRALDGALWIALLARSEDVKTPADLEAVRALLSKQYLSIGIAPASLPGRACTTCTSPPPDDGGNRAVHELQTSVFRWEASFPAGSPVGGNVVLGSTSEPAYQSVKLISDSTSGLTEAGVIKLQLPEKLYTWTHIEPSPGAPPVPLASFPRAGDMPPFLDDSAVEGRVIAWLRALPVNASPTEPPPKHPKVQQALAHVGANGVGVVQSIRQSNESIGTGSGQPGQQFSLAFSPVLSGTLSLSVLEDGVPVTWNEVDNFDAADERASVFVLDRALGLVSVGDGLQGRVVPDGAKVMAGEYWYGGGLAGNLPAGALRRLEPAPGDDVSAIDSGKTLNPVPTTGGSETQTVDQARRSIPATLRHQNRCVTADDFRELTLLTPGVAVGRAEVLPLYRPGAPAAQKFPGVVSVLVIPSEDPVKPRAPMPDLDFRQTVCRHLDKHRLITTELYIVPPRYQQIAVSVGIRAKSGFPIETLTNWICLALYQYFAPLPPFGPDAQGWPLGGRINRAAIEAVVLQVDGVAWVEELVLRRSMPKGLGDPVEQLLLSVTDLPELVQIDVGLGNAPAPTPPSPIGDKIPVPVPAPRTTC